MGVGLSYWLAIEWEMSHMSHVKQGSQAKESDESRGIGGRWGVVAGGRRVRSGRWSARRYSDGEYGSYSL